MASLPIYGNRFLEKFSLKGRTVVITGGGRGLGLTFANGLAQAGANIAIIDLAAQPAEDFRSLDYGGQYKYYQADVTDCDNLGKTITRIADEYGGIHGWYEEWVGGRVVG
jgi:sorbose reductase